MPYREKIAWLSLAAMVVSYGPYFAYLAWSQPSAAVPNLPLLGVLAAVSAVRVAVLGPLWLWFRASTPADDRLMDERDRDIERRAVGVAYYVLMTGALLAAMVMPFTTAGWDIVNAGLAAIVIAEITRDGLVVWAYRRRGEAAGWAA